MANDQLAIPAPIGDLPIGHLQLPVRVAAALPEVHTIQQMFDWWRTELQRRNRSETVGLHLRRIVGAVHVAIRQRGVEGWDLFRKSRPLFVQPATIYFFSPAFARLKQSARTGGLAKLHLSRRAITALNARGIAKIGNLIDEAKVGIVGLRASGQLTTTEIVESLDALADALTSEGMIDWVLYAEIRRFQILPLHEQTSYSGAEFLWNFPKACEVAVSEKFGPSGLVVLHRRVFRHRDLVVPLSELGRQLGQTGERARLLEASILKMLRRAVWQEEYRGCRFRFRPQFLRPLYELADRLQELPAATLSETHWRTLLRETWDMQPEQLGQQEALILELLGLDCSLVEGNRILLPSNRVAAGTSAVLKELKAFFRRRAARAMSKDEIAQHLCKKFAAAAPDQHALQTLLESLASIECEPATRRYRLRFEQLNDTADRCERILREHYAPMHYKDLAAEIERRLPPTSHRIPPRSVACRLAGSKRFTPIGRTGVWSLREWTHVETRTVADIAAELLAESGEPLTERQLFQLIQPLRSVRSGSIGTLLREDRRFRRPAPAVWELAAAAPLSPPDGARISADDNRADKDPPQQS